MKGQSFKAVLMTMLFITPLHAQDPAAAEQDAARQADGAQTATPTTQPSPQAQAPRRVEPFSPIQTPPLIPHKRPGVARDLKGFGGAGGLSRGNGGSQTQAIAPELGGATARPRPTLYFHLSEPVSGEVIATLTKGQEPEPVKEWKLSNLSAGIHALSFNDSDPVLEVGVKYSWVVQVRQHNNASKNPSDHAELVRVAGAAPPVAELTPADRVAQLADAGLYFDALDELLKDPSSHAGAELASRYRDQLRQALELQRSRPGPTTSLR